RYAGLAAGLADFPQGSRLGVALRRVLQIERSRGRADPVTARSGAGKGAVGQYGALDQRHRPGRPRLYFEDRRLSAALRVGRAGVLSGRGCAEVPARSLVSRPGRNPDGTRLYQRPAEITWRIHAAGYFRAASLRPLLQRQQIRRRNRSVRSARGREETLSDR